MTNFNNRFKNYFLIFFALLVFLLQGKYLGVRAQLGFVCQCAGYGSCPNNQQCVCYDTGMPQCPFNAGCRCEQSSFLPGTLVSTVKGEKKIEDIKIGDRVLSFLNDLVTQSSVSKVHKTKKDYYYILSAGDYEVKVTALHPFYIGNNQFKTVQDLKVGDYVYVLEDDAY